jgi:endonuclease-3
MTPKLPPKRVRVSLLLAELAKAYPDPKCGLDFKSPFQLAVATILSAQCTDKRVNLVTPALFNQFPTPQAFVAAPLSAVEDAIRTTGFFRNKAKSIRGFCEGIIRDHAGQVPSTLEELVKLPGIGRKTANVVLGDGFGIPGITVDTHVGRLSRRLGLTAHTDPVKVEFDLMKLIPQPEWTDASHRIILHGRAVCHARKPQCSGCQLAGLCPRIGVASPQSEPSATRPVQRRRPSSDS